MTMKIMIKKGTRMKMMTIMNNDDLKILTMTSFLRLILIIVGFPTLTERATFQTEGNILFH